MAHQIETFEDGTAAFFSARELPWHRLGQVVPAALTAAEAIEKAQQDWTVEKVPVFAKAPDGEFVPIDNKFATLRNHPKLGYGALGIVGNQYVPIQNHEAFEVLDQIRDDSGAAYETAGSLHGGKRVFMTMKMPESLVFQGKNVEADKVDMYLLAMNSHDASTAFTLAITPIRVVCANTLSMALSSNHLKRSFTLKHTRNIKGRVAEAREALGLTFAYVEQFEQEVQRLIDAEMNKTEFSKFIKTLYSVKGTSQKQETRVEKVQEQLMSLWNAPTQKNIIGTRWAAYNSVVEYIDWQMGVRVTRKESEDTVRAIRTVTGSADHLKNKALRLLLK